MMQNYGGGLPGMGMHGGGYDGVNIKQDPDDLLRLRGGAVSLDWQWWHCEVETD